MTSFITSNYKKVMIKSLYLMTLFLFSYLNNFSQVFSLLGGLGIRQTTEDGVYNTTTGIELSGGIRFTPIGWAYIQGGWGISKLGINDPKANKANLQTWDCQVGFMPFSEFPIHFYAGTLLHRYCITTNEVKVGGRVFFPSLKDKIKYDGVNIGVGYNLNKWFELRLTYEKEPFYLFKVSYTSNFLRLDLVGVIPFYKWGKAKTPVESTK
jgi:hypothetical protein